MRELTTSNELMTLEEMTEAISEKPNRRIYKAESDELKGEALAADIDSKTEALRRTASRSRVDLNDLHQVQDRTFQYMDACRAAMSFPSVLGLAALGYGYTAQGLNKYLREHPESPSAQFIEIVKLSFADILTNQALYRNADTTQVIFQLKNLHGYSDRIQVEPIQQEGPLGDVLTPEEIQAKYQDMIED